MSETKQLITDIVTAVSAQSIALLAAPTAAGAMAAAAFGGAATNAINRVVKSRTEAASQELLEELRHAKVTIFDIAAQDEFAAMLFGYQRAALEGVARQNLRLMAQVIRNQLEGGRLLADEFKYYADIIASLKRHEIIVLATMLRVDRELRAEKVELWEGQVPAHKIWERLDALLIRSHLFKSKEELRGVGWGLFRTGMLMLGNSLDEDMEAKPAPLLREIANLCDIEGAGSTMVSEAVRP